MRGGVEMGMAVVECEVGWRWVWRWLSARWGGDGYGGDDECEVGWRWVWRW